MRPKSRRNQVLWPYQIRTAGSKTRFTPISTKHFSFRKIVRVNNYDIRVFSKTKLSREEAEKRAKAIVSYLALWRGQSKASRVDTIVERPRKEKRRKAC